MSRQNNVQVTLSGRDQLSGVLNNVQKNMQSVARAGRILSGIGVASALLSMGSAAKRLAKDMGGDLQQEIKRTENLMNATVQTMIESTIGADGMSRANDFLAEQVLPRVITAFEMTRDAIKFVIEQWLKLVRWYFDGVNKIMDGLGKIIPGFNRLRSAVGENVKRFVEWGEAQVDLRREALQTTLRLNEQKETIEKMQKPMEDYYRVFMELTQDANRLTQEGIATIKAYFEAEKNRLIITRDSLEAQGILNSEYATTISRIAELEQRLESLNQVQTVDALGVSTEDVRSTATAISELSNATQHLTGLDEKYLNVLEQRLQGEKLKAIALRNSKSDAEEIAAANALVLQSEKALEAIRLERISRVDLDPVLEAWKESLRELAIDIDTAVQSILTDSIQSSFSNLFTMDFSSNIKQFGANILSGMGNIFADMGRAMIAASPIFKAIGAAMTNPFTAGPASAKFGLALVALGGALGGIATRVSGGVGGTPSTLSTSAGRLGTTNFSSRDVGGESTLIIQGGLLDMSDPRQANALGRAISELSGRRVILQGA